MKYKKSSLALLLGFVLLVLAAAPFAGMEFIPIEAVLKSRLTEVQAEIFWRIRIPRVLTAMAAGAALAVSGMAFQAIFRNVLATPFTLGVSGGAAFGAALYVKSGLMLSFLGFSGQSVSAFLGAVCSISIVYGLTHMKKGATTATMLLAGVAVSFFFSSLILFIQYLSDFTHSFRIIRWLMGGFEIVGYQPFYSLLPFATTGCAIVFFLSDELNLVLLGDDIAASRGVNLGAVKTGLFAGVSLMVGSVVAVCGPIGFIGMMSPHICRLIVGPGHRLLAPVTLLFGGAFLVLCDALSRILIAPAEIPVGVITALLGGPFFIWLLLRESPERGSFS